MGARDVSVLAGEELLRRLNEERDPARRLVVGPMLEPSDQVSPSQASIDVRLGCDFRLALASTIGVLDEFSDPVENHFSDLASVYDRFYVPLGASVTVHPHQFLLAMTLEYLRLPDDLMAYVVGRSTLGRLGLIIATAVGIHPRFYGPLTLEIRNLGEAPLRLYPGQVIAQLFLHSVDVGRSKDASDEGTKRPQYSGAVDTLPGRISNATTSAKLRKLRAEQIQGAEALRGGQPSDD